MGLTHHSLYTKGPGQLYFSCSDIHTTHGSCHRLRLIQFPSCCCFWSSPYDTDISNIRYYSSQLILHLCYGLSLGISTLPHKAEHQLLSGTHLCLKDKCPMDDYYALLSLVVRKKCMHGCSGPQLLCDDTKKFSQISSFFSYSQLISQLQLTSINCTINAKILFQ